MPRLLGILFVLALSRPVLGVSPSWVARWRGDLEFVRRTVPARHANAFHAISRHRFDSMLDALEKNLPSLGQHEIEVRLARIIAAIGDGHTRLSLPLAPGTDLPEGDSKTDAPSDASLLFHGYPLRFGIYADGTYVERIAPRFAKYAGSKLLAIDGHPTRDVIAAITPTIRHDNPSQRLDLLPSRLVLAELLHATGIVRDIDHAAFTLETPKGDRVDIVLAPQRGSVVHWADAKPAAARRPLAFRHLEGPSPMTGSFTKNYWLAWLPRSKTIYVQIDRSLDDHAEPLYDFASRLLRTVDEKPVEQLIVDLRWNHGGDNSLNRPLVHAIIRATKVDQPGRLFVITGRGTFSAGMMLAVDLESQTHAIFVGEPTGSRPNHFGDARKIILPATHLTIRVATLRWQYSDPRDHRDAITPQISFPPTWANWLAGRDPAVDSIVDPGPIPRPLPATWSGVMSPPFETIPIRLEIRAGTRGREGRLDAGPLGDALVVSAISTDGNRIRFGAASELGALAFNGRFIGERIVGEVVLANRRESAFPFAFHADSSDRSR